MIEETSTVVTFENDGGGTRASTSRVRIQSDAGVQRFAVLTFAYQNSSEALEIEYVRVHKPDGTIVVTPADGIQDMDAEITRQAPLYSDLREKHVAVKGLGKDDILEYAARWRTTKPLAPGQFWYSYNFGHDEIILKESLQISVPRERLVKWSSRQSKPVITESGGRRIFAWSSSQLARPSKEQSEKELESQTYQAGRGRIPQPEILLSSFTSWEELGRWYNGLQQERAKPTPEVRAKALELTKGLTDDDARARAIYNYVSGQIHYIGIDFGIGRYQPHSAAEVLSSQYGDCKDKHTLLAALLEAVNISASPALISSMQAVEPDVPSPGQFDHVISAIQLGGHLVWADATPEVGPFGYLLSSLRGKKALLISQSSALTPTPEDPPGKALQTFRIDAKLNDNGVLQGKIDQSFSSTDSEVVLRAAFRRVPLPQWKDLIQQISFASGFAGDVSDVTATSPDHLSEPFHFTYSYTRKDFPDWPNRRIGAPLPPFNLPADSPADDDNAKKTPHPFWLGSPVDLQFESHVELPKGYRPALPRNLELNEDFATYQRSVTNENGILITRRRLTIKRGDIPASQAETYEKFTKRVSDDSALNVLLSSGASAPALYQSEIWELPGTDNPDSARSYDDARAKIQHMDTDGAIDSLKHALQADPKFTRAWLWLGEIYKSTAKMDLAVQAYRKALEIDPGQPVCYKALGFGLIATGKTEASLAVWRQMIKALPDDSAGPEMLGVSLIQLKRYSEAAAPLETAASLNPESFNVQFQLGGAYLKSGQAAKAMLAYRKAIDLNSTPWMLNAIAYDLAEFKGDLTVAMDYSKKAVTEEAMASRHSDASQANVSQIRVEDLEFTRSLSAYWDTLGWVYFKMGNTAEAEKYLEPSWVLAQNGTIADHLGQVYERRNNKPAAIRMFKFALNRLTGNETEAAEIRKRLEVLAPGFSADPSTDRGIIDELNRTRTRKLPRLVAGEQTADFFLTFAFDPKSASTVIENVTFIKGSEQLRSAVPAVKASGFTLTLPPDGSPRVIRRAILGCYPVSGCSLVLLNPYDVTSVN